MKGKEIAEQQGLARFGLDLSPKTKAESEAELSKLLNRLGIEEPSGIIKNNQSL